MGQGCVRQRGPGRPQDERVCAHRGEGNVGKSWLSGKAVQAGHTGKNSA